MSERKYIKGVREHTFALADFAAAAFEGVALAATGAADFLSDFLAMIVVSNVVKGREGKGISVRGDGGRYQRKATNGQALVTNFEKMEFPPHRRLSLPRPD